MKTTLLKIQNKRNTEKQLMHVTKHKKTRQKQNIAKLILRIINEQHSEKYYEPFWFFTPLSRFLDYDYVILHHLFVLFCKFLDFWTVNKDTETQKQNMKVSYPSTNGKNNKHK